MKTYATFVAIGSVFATVEEFLTIVVLKRDIPSYLFTLIVLFPTYLSFVYFSSRIIDRLILREPVQDLAHLLTYGFLGLFFEWSLMGLSPWSNPAANPLLMLAFQVGMFAFWATVATAPRVFLDRRAPGRHARRSIVRFFVPYFALVYCVGLSVAESLQFAIIIPLIVVGYSVVTGLLFKWVVDLSRTPPANRGVNTQSGCVASSR